MTTNNNHWDRPPLAKGVTDPDAELSDYEVKLILEGLMIPSPNAVHALAKEVARIRVIRDNKGDGPQRDDL